MLSHPFPLSAILPDESKLYQNLGNVLLGHVAHISTFTLLYGIFVLLFSISTASFIRRGLSGRPIWAMFGTTVLTFTLVTLNTASKISAFAILIRSPLVDNADLPLDAKTQLTNVALFVPNIITLWTTNFPPIIGDIVIIWRASVFFKFPEQRWMMIAPCCLLLGTIGTTFSYVCLSSNPTGVTSLLYGGLVNDLIVAAIGLSTATNAITILLITYKLWSFRKTIQIVDNLALKRQSPVQRVLFLVVESGAIYFGLQLLYLILNVLPHRNTLGSSQDIAAQVFSAAYITLTAMYPTIVVVLVYNQRSFVDNYGFSTVHTSRIGHNPGPDQRPPAMGRPAFPVPWNQNQSISSIASLPIRPSHAV